MRKILKFSFLMTVVAAAASFAGSVKTTKPSEAKGGGTSFDYTVKELLTNIYNNDLDDVTCNESFDYGVRHGHLNTGTSPAVGKFTTKGVNEGDMSSGSGAAADWAGARLTSLNDDRFIFKFVAKTPINVAVKCSDPKGWIADTNVSCYIVKSDVYSEDAPNWLNHGEEMINVPITASSTGDDFMFTAPLAVGEVLYYQWGFQWGEKAEDTRTFQAFDSGFKFSINYAPEDFTMKELLSEITSDKYYSTNLMDRKTYSVSAFHGNMEGTNPRMLKLTKTTGPNEGELEGGDVVHSDWAGMRLHSSSSDFFMIRFYSRSYLKINWRALSYTGGIDGSKLKVYKCGVNFDDDPDDCDDFSLVDSANLSGGEPTDACGSCSIGPGESLVWAWGSDDVDWTRTWETDNSGVGFTTRQETYDKLQEEANKIESLSTLAYTYTVSGNTYSNVSFKVGVGFNYANISALEYTGISMLGIQFRSANENMKDDVGTVLFNVYSLVDCIFQDEDNEIIYTILDFGDALNNPSRLTDEFRLNYFVKFGDFVITSSRTKTTSICAMVDQYADMGEPVEGLKSIVDALIAE